MRAMRSLSPAAALLLLVACGGGDDDDGDDGGGGPDVVGAYQVTSHRESHQQGDPVPCDDPGPEIEPGDPGFAPVFAIAVDDFLDDPDFLVLQTCGEGGADCVDTLVHLERTGDTLASTDANTQTGDDSCNLYAGRSVLTVADGTVTVEDRRWTVFDHPVDDCTIEAAEALVDTPDCRDVVVWVGTPLAAPAR
jgi:hypothetical protein